MITFIYPYYENGLMLERHLREWSSYSDTVKAELGAIVVDDGSPSDPAASHVRSPGFPVELYRIKKNIPWNVPGARNLAMDRARDGWCLLTDIDHLVEKDQAEKIIAASSSLDMKRSYGFKRRWADGRPLRPHPNSYLLQRSLYWRIGGTDEDWSGWWGAGENVFRKALRAAAGGTIELDVYLSHFGRDDIADASTREWGRRGSRFDWANNPKLVAKHRGAPYRPDNPLRFEWEESSWP